jgi:hypothetical protein
MNAVNILYRIVFNIIFQKTFKNMVFEFYKQRTIAIALIG